MGTAGPRRANWTVIGIVSIPFGYEYSGHSLGTAHTVTVNSLNESINQSINYG
jgi:hypothetical protein